MSTWPWAPAPSSATLISCRPAAAAGVVAAAASLPRRYCLLPAPGVAEEPERGDRGQPHQQVAPTELRWPAGRGGRLALSLVVLVSHQSSPAVVRPRREYTRALTVRLAADPADRCRHHGPESGVRRARRPRDDSGTAEVEQVRRTRRCAVRKEPGLEARDCARTRPRSRRRVSTMNAVVNASATAAGASRARASGRAGAAGVQAAAARPTPRAARAPARPCADPGCGRLCARRTR